MENIYSPPIGALFEPIQIAAQNALAEQRAEQAGGRVMSALSDAKRNLRKRSEEHLRLAVLSELGRDQPSTVEPYKAKGGRLWSTLFVPVYRRVPWAAKEKAMGALGMTARAGRRPSASRASRGARRPTWPTGCSSAAAPAESEPEPDS